MKKRRITRAEAEELARNDETYRSLPVARIKQLDAAIMRGLGHGAGGPNRTTDWSINAANERSMGLLFLQEFMRGASISQARETADKRRRAFIESHNAELHDRNQALLKQAKQGNRLAAHKVRELGSQWGAFELDRAEREIEKAVSLVLALASNGSAAFLGREIRPGPGPGARFELLDGEELIGKAPDLIGAVTLAYQTRNEQGRIR